MAIGTIHQAFVHAVMERAVELLFGLEMTPIAKLRRLLFHQELRFLGTMRRMAVDAAHVVLHVRRTREIAVLLAEVMAFEAALTDLFRRGILEGKNLSFVAATFDVRPARPMACFAAVPRWSVLFVEHGHVVGRV